MKPAILCFTPTPGKILVEQSHPQLWQIVPVLNTQQAFQALANQPFEAVAAEGANQPCPSEDNFFIQVMQRFPQPSRILLFDPQHKKELKTPIGTVHQCLATPTPSHLLVSAAQRARFITALMGDPAVQALLPSLRKLPSIPSTYFRVIQALQSPDTDLQEIGAVMAEDWMMSAKLLQIVNSAYFALPNAITNVPEAIGQLGLERTKSLVLVAHVFSAFEGEKASSFSVDKLWKHSLSVARAARQIAKYETGDSALAEAAYTAGLLHDVGKFILAANIPQKYNEVLGATLARKVSFGLAELQILGATHAQIGAAILGTWGLPGEIVEAIAYHHQPSSAPSKGFSVLTAVHGADALDRILTAPAGTNEPPRWEKAYMESLGMLDRMDTWRALVQKQAMAA